ncbi:MAG: FAD-binding oxidoreductase [Gemmatimonadaceae bacterium]
MIDSPNTPIWDDPQWGDAAWTSLPVLDSDKHCSTCVIGLGGSGLTAIDELLDRGDDVLGVDAYDVGAGAAGRNGGFLLAGAYDFYHDAVRLHGAVRARAIYRATLQEIQRIAAATPHSVRFVGSRRLAASEWEIDDCKKQLIAMQSDGWQAEWYEGDDGIGLTLPSDASFNPLVRCRALANLARSRGARLFSQSAVTEISAGCVVTSRGTIHCQRVIVAVDGKLEQILPELAGRVRTARLQMLATEPTAERIVPCPMYYREGYEYWQQLPNGSIAIGGFRDKAMENEWTLDTNPANPIQRLLEQFLRDKLGVQAPITHRWAASAGYSNTGLPVLGKIRDGVWAIGGYSGTGNVIGALCGRAVVALALDGDASQARLLVPLSQE